MKKTQIGVYVSQEWVDNLKQIAREESINQDRKVTYMDLVRLAIKTQYNFKETIIKEN